MTSTLLGLVFASFWITGDYQPPAETNEAAFFEAAPNPVVSTAFDCRAVVKRAVWKVAAPGMRDLFVNNVRVSPTALPPWTPYRKRVLEESFDVTSQIVSGPNNLRIELGNGWYNLLPIRMWYFYNLRDAVVSGVPCVKATLELTYADGTTEKVETDGTWRAWRGRIVKNSIYLGVVEDQRRTLESVGAARVVQGPAGKVVPAGDFPKTVIISRRKAQRVTKAPNGAWLVDFGVNATGTIRAKLHDVKDGQKVSFRAGELKHADGSVNVMTAVAGQIKDPKKGPLYAIAEQRDRVICRAAKELVFEPRFTFHVFRYVQVEGLETEPRAEDFEALDWSADIRDAASFTCSDARFNKLHEICRRTFRSNLQSVQSDCPGREKFGYGGDIGCTCESLLCNYDMKSFYRKTVRDFLDEAEDDGFITETAPFVGIASRSVYPLGKDQGRYEAQCKTRAAPIGWATGVPVLVDAMVRYCGDLETMREAFPALVRFIGLLEARYPDNEIPKCLGDWLPVAGNRADQLLTGLAHYRQFVTLTARFARLLGDEQTARRLDARAESIAATWRRHFLHADGLVGSGYQTEQVFGLWHGLVPATDCAAAYRRLKDDIHSRGDALTTGISGTQLLLEYLSSHGDADLAGKVVAHKGFPGWFDMIDRGATTIWEEWDEEKCLDVHSNCHPMFCSCEQWMTRYVLGIRVTDDAVGCDKVIIEPHAVCGLTWAKGHLDTPHGRISVAWHLENGQLKVEKTVPSGITLMKGNN